MRKRTIAIASALCLGGVIALMAGFIGAAWYIEHQRIRDANPAFLPLVPLGVVVFSNQVAFYRYCTYEVMFPPTCTLCDSNVSALASLNTLPERNGLDVFIQTPKVTDSSLPHLKRIHKIDILDVTKSGISDDGIAELQEALPTATVVDRKSDYFKML